MIFTADKWRDYELIDCSDGQRLERWGSVITVRPDPQVIWQDKKNSKLWNRAQGVYKRSSSGGGSWVKNDMPENWEIRYGTLGFNIHPMSFKHTGLFPEQAVNWDWFSDLIKKAGRPVSVLNLFAYTGGVTVAAAAAGADVVHVDAAKGMVAQAKDNAMLSGLGSAHIRYIVDDCKKFVLREIRRGNKYDGIIMDPPSYGRGPSGETWKLEECIDGLLGLCMQLLSDKPLFFLLNSYTAGLSASTMECLLKLNIKKGGVFESGEVGLPVTEKKIVLPCGCAARWYSEQ